MPPRRENASLNGKWGAPGYCASASCFLRSLSSDRELCGGRKASKPAKRKKVRAGCIFSVSCSSPALLKASWAKDLVLGIRDLMNRNVSWAQPRGGASWQSPETWVSKHQELRNTRCNQALLPLNSIWAELAEMWWSLHQRDCCWRQWNWSGKEELMRDSQGPSYPGSSLCWSLIFPLPNLPDQKIREHNAVP